MKIPNVKILGVSAAAAKAPWKKFIRQGLKRTKQGNFTRGQRHGAIKTAVGFAKTVGNTAHVIRKAALPALAATGGYMLGNRKKKSTGSFNRDRVRRVNER